MCWEHNSAFDTSLTHIRGRVIKNVEDTFNNITMDKNGEDLSPQYNFSLSHIMDYFKL